LQTLDSQLEQLRKAGCASRNIYREKVTGARADRRELNRMLGKLAPGDVVTVTLDRLARSTFDLFAIVKRIADAKAQSRSLEQIRDIQEKKREYSELEQGKAQA
jgi:DNA invertase Pin-like site-specific DNA recombinase